jgi:ABC-type transport system substrate-binding protein
VAHHSDFHPSARLETVYLTLNERTAPFNNEKVRLAFAHAVNKESIARQVYSDFAHPTDGLMPPGLPGYNPKLRGASYNPALARRLLAEAGFPGGRGLPVITYPVDQDAQAVLLANALAGQWRRVLGVQVRTKQFTHSAYLDLLSRLGYQIAVIDWTQDYPDPQNFLSQQLRTGVPNNNGGWSNATFDHLVDRADRLSGTSGERLQLYRQAEEIAMSQGAVIPLVNPKAGILMRTDVHGLTISGGYILVPDWTRVSDSGGTTG